jgi:ABC-type Na+ efflux pump permease subunit
MMQTGAQSLWQYAIPVYNCNLCLKGIITGNINFNQLLLTFGTTIVYVVLLIYVLIKMFKNERILFSR